jgi:NTE family protein
MARGGGPRRVSRAIEASLPFALGDSVARMVSPYAAGPFYRNPLRRIVERFHYDAVCGDPGPAFHICATNVRTGKIRVFTGDEIGPEAIMASACLPTLFKAVEIDDPQTGRTEAYWDGGYTGNPALFPLFAPDLPGDIVVVNINPLHPRGGAGHGARDPEPHQRDQLQRLAPARVAGDRLRAAAAGGRHAADGRMKRLRLHMIADDALMRQLSVATKLVGHAAGAAPVARGGPGAAAADAFLEAHLERHRRVRRSVDLRAMFG